MCKFLNFSIHKPKGVTVGDGAASKFLPGAGVGAAS
jgi:hypothetical protein